MYIMQTVCVLKVRLLQLIIFNLLKPQTSVIRQQRKITFSCYLYISRVLIIVRKNVNSHIFQNTHHKSDNRFISLLGSWCLDALVPFD
jgi:hypothetical protein